MRFNYRALEWIIKEHIPERYYVLNHVRIDLFEEALRHESVGGRNYDRLEFLGDALFHLVITHYFYNRYQDESEGFLTKIRIRIERGDSMAELAKKLGLNYYVQAAIEINESILEDIFEAFLGAFYLNFGMEILEQFVIRLIEKYKDLSALIFYDDNYKDILLRYFHQMKWGHPVYQVDQEYHNGLYISRVHSPSGQLLGEGRGTSKKKSEQMASWNALKKLEVIVDGEIRQEVFNDSAQSNRIEKAMEYILNPKNRLMDSKAIRKILEKYHLDIHNMILDIKIFREAMTHRSYLWHPHMSKKKRSTDKKDDPSGKGSSGEELPDNKKSFRIVGLQKHSNERLQFLGDAVIHFIVGEYLFHHFSREDEGFLTRVRCRIENIESLFRLAQKIGLAEYMLVSRNVENLHGRNNINIIGGGLEAFTGALYLTLGINLTRQFWLEVIRLEIDILELVEQETNYKDIVLQLFHRRRWGRPDYRLLSAEGPDHAKTFTVGLFLNGKLMGKGSASSKKRAEQLASKVMIEKYKFSYK